jgi:uncharacterized protein (DUF427 family)
MTSHPGPTESERECVWDYPRPPRLEPTVQQICVELAGVVLADSGSAIRVLETSHPPVYYIPTRDIEMKYLAETPDRSYCEWKGMAGYYGVVMGDRRLANVAWFYPNPKPRFEAIRNHVAFYPGPMDGCFVGGERVVSQPGDFYGGWITSNLVGPFKGGTGSHGW